MEADDDLKLELIRARNELTFLLSEQIQARAEEVRAVRQRIGELLETINRGSSPEPRAARPL